MTKREYTIKQISKTNKKNYENYVVTRIYHRLNRSDVKFITQQYVNRPEGKGHALTDLYFPQLRFHVEIDEPFHKKQELLDIDRETDIIQATNHEFFRIIIKESLEEINDQIDQLLMLIKSKIETIENEQKWEPWDLEKEFQPSYFIKKGYLHVDENPAFRKIIDACNCLGQNYEAVQRGWFKSKIYPNHFLWFPKFYINEEWDNRISEDGNMIIEKCKNPEKFEEWYKGVFSHDVKRIVFPRSIDNLGFKLYKFVGIFETDFENSSFENGVIHRLVSKSIDISGEK